MGHEKAVLLALKIAGRSINGPDSWALRLLPWLRAAGIDARASVLLDEEADENTDLVVLLKQANVPTSVQRCQNMRADTEWFMKEVASLRPCLFIPNYYPAALYAAWNLRDVGIRSAMMIHSDDPYYYKLIDSFVLSGEKSAVDIVVPVSAYLEEKLAPALNDRVSLTRIHYGAPRSTAVAQWESGDMHLLYVGRFSQFQKRVDEVAKALCLACDQIPGVRASMVGDGPHRSLVETILRTTPGGEKVKLLGGMSSPDVLKVMPTAHVMVLLSDFEGIPISLMEGMAAGLVPVVTPIRSGIPELVFDGKTGFIVEDRREAFVAAIRRLRDDPALWQRMSGDVRSHFEQGFSPESVIAAWTQLIGDCPAPFALPTDLHFPVNSWLDFWVDGSMAMGPRKLRLFSQKWLWKTWSALPEHWRSRARAFAKRVLSHDGTQTQKN
jgi:glycosyltransferase involved in cell wall biosynthesis